MAFSLGTAPGGAAVLRWDAACHLALDTPCVPPASNGGVCVRGWILADLSFQR